MTILGQQIRFESWPPGTIGFPKSEKNSVSVGLMAHLQGGGIQGASLAYANLALRKWNYLALLLKDGKLGWAHNNIIAERRAGWNAVGNMNRLLRPKDFIVGGYHEIVAEMLGVKFFNKMTYFSGYIDEIRISKVARYNFPVGGEEAFNPPRRLEADRHTLALWHFDDGNSATLFADASGNGYHLIGRNGAKIVGTFSVNLSSSISTTWGEVKSQ